MSPLQIFGIEGWEILLIVVVLVVLFGAKKIPELARSLGRAKAEFQRGQMEAEELESSKSSVSLDREKLEKVAKDLGISVEGKSDSELQEEIRKALTK